MNHENGLWKLAKQDDSKKWDNNNFSASASHYQIGIDVNGWYTSDKNHYNANNICTNISEGSTDCRSIFGRDIQISGKKDGEFYVLSTVHWQNNGQPRSVSLEALITNWKANYQ